MKYLKYWAFLGVSILLEVSGTSIMKLSQSTKPLLGMLIMYILLAVSYYFLSLAIKRLPLGVACAFWESIGLVLIAAVGVFLLKENLSLTQIFALGLVLGGSMLVNHGTSSGKKEKTATSPEANPIRNVQAQRRALHTAQADI